MDMVGLSKHNDVYKYVLVAIDIFSRYAHCQPVKTKQGVDVVKALRTEKTKDGEKQSKSGISIKRGQQVFRTQRSPFVCL